jgi:hypothetical protein
MQISDVYYIDDKRVTVKEYFENLIQNKIDLTWERDNEWYYYTDFYLEQKDLKRIVGKQRKPAWALLDL